MTPNQSPTLLTTATFVLWTLCLAVGIAGFAPTPSAVRPTALAPIDATLISIQAVPSPAQQPPRPQPPSVAPSDKPVSFAEPVHAPPRQNPNPNPSPQSAPNNSPIPLTLGQGQGDQPPPDYPDEARFAGQEGTVVILFTVNESGRVTDAQAISPCRWPILNAAALRAIRTTWRFPRGPVRRFEVAIEFHLNINS